MHAVQPDNTSDCWMRSCCESALQANIASWRRRNTRLLVINCGKGLCLQMLWECGFDVTGTSACPSERALAARVAPHGTEILAAADDDIPVDADDYEWVILHLGDHDARQTRLAVQEAIRIASRGVVICFWNRGFLLRPLPFLWRKRFHLPCRGQYLWQVLRAVRGFTGRKWLSGCLPLPFMWGFFGLLGGAGRVCSALLGAWVMLRIDLDPAAGGTPLGLRVGSSGKVRQEAAVLECRAGGQVLQKDESYVPEGKPAESQT